MIYLIEIPEPFKTELEVTLDNNDYNKMEEGSIWRCEDASTDFGKWLVSQGEEEFAGEVEFEMTLSK